MLFCTTVFFRSIDPLIGKADKSCFSHQTLMELLIDEITNKREICGYRNEPKNIEDWRGVTLNEQEEVASILWTSLGLSGDFIFDRLPSSVTRLFVNQNRLHGSIEISSLPGKMVVLVLTSNLFSGSIDLTCLPSTIKDLDVAHNALFGTIDLTHLPGSLKSLYLSDNEFVGETDFSRLPASLEYLDVSFTELEGDIHLEDGKGFYAELSNLRIHKATHS